MSLGTKILFLALALLLLFAVANVIVGGFGQGCSDSPLAKGRASCYDPSYHVHDGD
jgi:hypothetical protein